MSDNFRFSLFALFILSSFGCMLVGCWHGGIEADEKAGRHGSWAAVSWQERVEKWREAGRPGPRPRCY
jgi:hypothetical protein